MFVDEFEMHRGINMSMKRCEIRRANMTGYILKMYKEGKKNDHPEMMVASARGYLEYEKLVRNLGKWINRFPEQPASLKTHPVNVVCENFKAINIDTIWDMPFGKKRFDRVAAALVTITHGNFDPLTKKNWVVHQGRVLCTN
ncbi:hypothetical protein CJU89_4227 [Yarrowia sp. B02]|nr:hypothetical protein CJU89_4227 [Yarrowia sp. B02]